LAGRIVRVSKKNTIYIPKDIAKSIGISEGTYLMLTVKNNKLVITPIPDPFWLALKGPKFAETTAGEIERISEEEQEAYVTGNTS
jgi:AbrB family looped-hinge helix DNA binding protein